MSDDSSDGGVSLVEQTDNLVKQTDSLGEQTDNLVKQTDSLVEQTELTVLITNCSDDGGQGSITRKAALQFCEPLAAPFEVKTLVLHYHRGQDPILSATDVKTVKHRVKIHQIEADLTKLNQVRTLVDKSNRAARDDGSPPVNVLLVNNVSRESTMPPPDTLVNTDVFKRAIHINTIPTYRLTELLVPSMAQGGFGRVIYRSCINHNMQGLHHASAFHALHGLLTPLANIYGKKGVTFNVLEPTFSFRQRLGSEFDWKNHPKRTVGLLEVVSAVLLIIENPLGAITKKFWSVGSS